MNSQDLRTRDTDVSREAFSRFVLRGRPEPAEDATERYEHESPAALLHEAGLAEDGIMAEAERIAHEMEEGGSAPAQDQPKGGRSLVRFLRGHAVQIVAGAAALGFLAGASRSRGRSATPRRRKDLRSIIAGRLARD